jgi:NAD(P)-dependent dehydrogenase (short-subunit alcohol dehydrogenase family)
VAEQTIDFTDQVAIVSGAGRGLGRLYALELARRGAKVVVNDIGGSVEGQGFDATIADAVVSEIEAAGGEAVASHDSVDTPEGGAAIVQAGLDAFGRVDAVISNAGIYGTVAFDEMSVEQWRRMLQIHLDGSFYLAQPAYRVMKAQGYGRFVFVASSIGAFGEVGNAHYSSAKGGIIGLTNTLAVEGAPHGIKANTILPIGFSRMVTETVGDDVNEVSQRFYDAIQPERVAPMAVYLASRACELSHHNISSGAGRYARVFMGLVPGWLADREGPVPTVEDVHAHVDEITSTEGFWIPQSMGDEAFDLMKRLGIL